MEETILKGSLENALLPGWIRISKRKRKRKKKKQKKKKRKRKQQQKWREKPIGRKARHPENSFHACLSIYTKLGRLVQGCPKCWDFPAEMSLLPGTSATISEYLVDALNGASQVCPEWKRGSSSQPGLEWARNHKNRPCQRETHSSELLEPLAFHLVRGYNWIHNHEWWHC